MKHIGIHLRWTAAAVLLLALLGGCGRATSPLQDQAAPDFTLPLLEGGEMNLAAHRGNDVVVLDFWAVWCGPCREGLPAIAELAQQFEGQPVAVYAVNLGDSRPQIEGFLKAEGVNIAVALDAEAVVGEQFQVRSIPTTLVIDRKGVVRHSHIGFSPSLARETAASIEALLNEEG
jgi:thiol-disulfide isomerase/thioredoxin